MRAYGTQSMAITWTSHSQLDIPSPKVEQKMIIEH